MPYMYINPPNSQKDFSFSLYFLQFLQFWGQHVVFLFVLTDMSPASTVTTLSQSSTGATKTLKPLSVPQGKISMNMNVLARTSAMNWKWGKIENIVSKG